MDLVLIMLSLVLAILVLVLPAGSGAFHLLQIVVVILLGALTVMKFLQSRRPAQKQEKAEIPKERPAAAPAPAAPAPSPDALVEAGVVQFLARLQEKGRLVDFLMDDVTPYSNEQVGVVARVVHQGCREVLHGTFDIEPVHPGQERDAINLAGDFDAATYRLVGKVPDRPPYQGTVLHRGWKATRISFPRLADAPRDSAARKIIAPAEVEIG